jgi:transposase
MRGQDNQQSDMFSYLSPETRVRKDHPLRAIREMADKAFAKLSARFDEMYAQRGRPSIAPEKLLRAQLLQMLYSVRNLDEPVWDVTVFTKNRDRLLDGDVARAFLSAVIEQAQEKKLTSDEHFTVDGTLLEAWAGAKSFRRKDEKDCAPPDDPGNPTVNFHSERRVNETHESKTDKDALMARKGSGKEAKLSYSAHLLMENRNGLIVLTELLQANGRAERDAALLMLEQLPGTERVTVGADKAYDTQDFVRECHHLNVTPQVAQNVNRPGGSSIDGRTTRHAGYAVSQRKRKRIEECFGWLKTIAPMRKVRHRGLAKVGWVFTFAAATYNLVRLKNLGRAKTVLAANA